LELLSLNYWKSGILWLTFFMDGLCILKDLASPFLEGLSPPKVGSRRLFPTDSNILSGSAKMTESELSKGIEFLLSLGLFCFVFKGVGFDILET